MTYILNHLDWWAFYFVWHLEYWVPNLSDAFERSDFIGWAICRLGIRWIDRHPNGGWGPE